MELLLSKDHLANTSNFNAQVKYDMETITSHQGTQLHYIYLRFPIHGTLMGI